MCGVVFRSTGRWWAHFSGIAILWTRLAAPWALGAAWLSGQEGVRPFLVSLTVGPLGSLVYTWLYALLPQVVVIPARQLKRVDLAILFGSVLAGAGGVAAYAPASLTQWLWLPGLGLFVSVWVSNWYHGGLPTGPGESGVPNAPLCAVPIRGPITAGYQSYDRSHSGVDLGLPAGTPLPAPAAGRVIHAGPLGHWGGCVEVDHGEGWSSFYGHLDSVAVSRGQSVEPGAILGLTGSSGISTGPHLHVELRYRGVAVNPAPFIQTVEAGPW